MLLPTERAAFQPRAPRSIEETGISQGLILDLLLRQAFFEGIVTLGKLSERSKLNPTIVHWVYRYLLKEQLAETRAMVGNDYEISLTSRGRSMAEVALKKGQYAGSAPVSLKDYNESVSAQGIHVSVTAASMRSALGDLVVPEHVIRSLGAALVTGGTILLHGPTGNGKTSIAERLHRIFNDSVWIPYAVEVSGQILTVFDPLLHKAEEQQPPMDSRWVLCRRPMVKVGGEMRAEMLEPMVDEVTRICTAPLQMKANTGILLIDDFGRQRITPRELLNRWIVPLDRRTDVLSLWSGVSFEMPFEVLVVFATNLALSDLAEEAFMRRLKHKIRIDPLGTDLFKNLVQRVFQRESIPCTAETEEYIAQQCARYSPEGLRACFPHDIAEIIRGTAIFEQREPSLSPEDIDRAVNVYFGH
jgi:predicted ATPase with chaperone activity